MIRQIRDASADLGVGTFVVSRLGCRLSGWLLLTAVILLLVCLLDGRR